MARVTQVAAVRATAAATVIGTASGVKAAGVKHGASIMTGGLAYLITATRRRQHHHT